METEQQTLTDRKTILSGITPSGRLHIGNYFGAMKQHIELQQQGDAYFFYCQLPCLNLPSQRRAHAQAYP